MDQAAALMDLAQLAEAFFFGAPRSVATSNAFVYETKTFNVSRHYSIIVQEFIAFRGARFVYIPPDLQEKPRLDFFFAPLTAREIPMSHPLSRSGGGQAKNFFFN